MLDGAARADEIAHTRRIAADLEVRCVVIITRCSDAVLHRTRIEGRARNIPGWPELDWEHVTSFLERWDVPVEADLYLDAIASMKRNSALLRAKIAS